MSKPLAPKVSDFWCSVHRKQAFSFVTYEFDVPVIVNRVFDTHAGAVFLYLANSKQEVDQLFVEMIEHRFYRNGCFRAELQQHTAVSYNIIIPEEALLYSSIHHCHDWWSTDGCVYPSDLTPMV